MTNNKNMDKRVKKSKPYMYNTQELNKFIMLIVVKKSLKIAKRSSEAKNQRRSDKMQKRPKEKDQKNQQ